MFILHNLMIVKRIIHIKEIHKFQIGTNKILMCKETKAYSHTHYNHYFLFGFQLYIPRQQVPSSAQTWIPLLGLSFKINVDAAMGPRFSIIVAVARDRRREAIMLSKHVSSLSQGGEPHCGVHPLVIERKHVLKTWWTFSNRRGELVFIDIIKVNTTLPLQAEAKAIK